MFNRKDYLLVEEVAKMLGCTEQNIYKSIWKGCLRAIKYDGIRYVKREWVTEWRSHYRSKQESTFDGEKTFDRSKGELSVKDVSKILGKKEQTIYYFVRSGQLPCVRKGSYVVIHKDDLKAFMDDRFQIRFA